MELFYGCVLNFLLNLTMEFNSLSHKTHNVDCFYCKGGDEGDCQVTGSSPSPRAMAPDSPPAHDPPSPHLLL